MPSHPHDDGGDDGGADGGEVETDDRTNLFEELTELSGQLCVLSLTRLR